MNYVALFTGVLVLLAAAVHAAVGGREVGLLKPEGAGKPAEVWVQTLAGWHWVSLDQLLAGGTFLLIGSTNWILHEATVLHVLSAYFALCGVVWLVVVLVAGRDVPGRLYRLGQWIYCFLIAGLSVFAAG